MESKLNHTTLDRYSEAFTDKVSRPFFDKNEFATGEQLLEISPVKQVNLFVVMALFQAWKQEFSKLKSPFFDYQAKEVRKGLKEFMNTLSRHIAVEEATLKVLMRSAVRQALLLSLSPYDFFAQLINSNEHTRVSLSDLKDWRKYIKVNRPLMDGLIGRFEQEEIKEAFNDEAFRIFNEVLETGKVEPEEYETHLSQFNAVVPIHLNDVWSDMPETQEEVVPPQPAPPQAAPKPLATFEDDEKEESEEAEGPATLNDQWRKEQRTLADDLNQQQKVGSLKQFITLNQRYMFVRDLFGNDPEAFNKALEQVEAQGTLDDALRVLVDNHASHRGWDMDSVPVSELLDVISKRYA
ncbi:MAG TPA: hypothetical protein DCR93_25670 [Cytophagales bacterium]|nr:hypothetical protein [Cytophagales bacterium]HAP62743.1 hypothetical protein [Cytophagales bacterium]